MFSRMKPQPGMAGPDGDDPAATARRQQILGRKGGTPGHSTSHQAPTSSFDSQGMQVRNLGHDQDVSPAERQENMPRRVLGRKAGRTQVQTRPNGIQSMQRMFPFLRR